MRFNDQPVSQPLRTLALLAVFLLLISNLAAQSTPIPKVAWAESIELAGVPNLHKVSPDLYRSAQPSAEGMKNLKKLGVKTIINLRSFHSDRDLIADSGLEYEHIYMKTWHPEVEDVKRFLQIVTDPSRTPVLVHCQHGADRTGAMLAIYRVVVQGWTKAEALHEMTEGGFGFHEIWSNLLEWIESIDVAELKRSIKAK